MKTLYRRARGTKEWHPVPHNEGYHSDGYEIRFFSSQAAADAAEDILVEVGLYSKFVEDYYRKGLAKYQRLGQAFINEMLPHDCGIVDPDLFHERDARRAEEKIFERYIKKD